MSAQVQQPSHAGGVVGGGSGGGDGNDPPKRPPPGAWTKPHYTTRKDAPLLKLKHVTRRKIAEMVCGDAKGEQAMVNKFFAEDNLNEPIDWRQSVRDNTLGGVTEDGIKRTDYRVPLLGQTMLPENDEPCTHCASGKGPWESCRSHPEHFSNACMNCLWGRTETTAKCSNMPARPNTPTTPRAPRALRSSRQSQTPAPQPLAQGPAHTWVTHPNMANWESMYQIIWLSTYQTDTSDPDELRGRANRLQHITNLLRSRADEIDSGRNVQIWPRDSPSQGWGAQPQRSPSVPQSPSFPTSPLSPQPGDSSTRGGRSGHGRTSSLASNMSNMSLDSARSGSSGRAGPSRGRGSSRGGPSRGGA